MAELVTDLSQIAGLAERQRDDTQAFAYYVETMWDREGRSDTELDTLVEQIAAEVTPQVDCTVCANCCRSMHVGLLPGDIPRLGQALQQTPRQVMAQWVDTNTARDLDEWAVFRARPCPMLRGSLCRVYDARPGACRDYPSFTPDFRWRMDEILEGSDQCPIIFNVIERLKQALGW